MKNLLGKKLKIFGRVIPAYLLILAVAAAGISGGTN